MIIANQRFIVATKIALQRWVSLRAGGKRERRKKDRQEIDFLCRNTESRAYVTKSPSRVAFRARDDI